MRALSDDAGSKVSLTCFGRSQAVYYGSDETAETGKYQLTVSSYIDGKKLNPINCFVRLVYSPDPVCNIATDINGGLTGARLDIPTTENPNITKYRLHSFFYTTPTCNELDKIKTRTKY